MADSSVADKAVSDPAEKAEVGDAVGTTAAGTLTIKDRVGEQIGEHTALAIAGVLRHRSALGMITGGHYPRVSVDMTQKSPPVRVDIAVAWPSAVTTICQEVRQQVSDELTRLTGTTPSRVDVTVAEVISRRRSTQDGEVQ